LAENSIETDYYFLLALCQRFERCQNIKQKKDLVVNEIKGSFKKPKAK